MPNSKIIVLSLPRSGSSLLMQLIASAGYEFNLFSDYQNSFQAHEFNKHGYFEDVPFILLNDQLIKLYFGQEYSFLYPPAYDGVLDVVNLKQGKLPDYYEYDVDEKNVFIPEDFLEDVESFTGTNWDVWGITRMVNGGKWERCYSKNNIETKEKILQKKRYYKELIENSDCKYVLKDPRLALVMPIYDLNGIKVIWIKRRKDDVLRSMRRHYGPRMFSREFIPGTEYVSNHFNYKVQFMDFGKYCERFQKFIEYSLFRYPHLIVEFDDLVNLHNIEKLEDFIGGSVDRSIIDSQLVNH